MNKKGFTLIELLVAMAIIAVLIGLSVFAVSQALRASRDATRQSIVKDIQAAIAIYQGKYRTVPTTIDPAGSPVDGKTTIYVGTTSKNVPVTANMEVYRTTDQSIVPGTTEAYYCYKEKPTNCPANAGSGYALGIKQESGDWYYITECKCF